MLVPKRTDKGLLWQLIGTSAERIIKRIYKYIEGNATVERKTAYLNANYNY
jgi:hypothetical protein